LKDFRQFITFFCQEFDYNALFRANITFASLTFLTTTKLRSSKQQVGELPWNGASTFHILLLSTDLPAFLNYEQIIIHICPRLIKYENRKITSCLRIAHGGGGGGSKVRQ
jgi:hypothetical protein